MMGPSPIGSSESTRTVDWGCLDPEAARIRISGATEAARAFVLASMAQERSRMGLGGPIVIVAPTEGGARSLYQDLHFFADPIVFRVLYFPSWNLSPLEPLSPDPRTVGDRLSCLTAWSRGEDCLTVTTVDALCRKTIPSEEILRSVLHLSPGDRLDRDELLDDLIRAGYQRSTVVEDEGEYAVRGALVDVFPPQMENPVRIEFDEESVSSLRGFQVGDQRSVGRMESVEILPAREVILSREDSMGFAAQLRNWAATRESGERDRLELLADRLEEEGHYPGFETFLPMFRPDLAAGVDLLPPEAMVAVDEPDQFAEADAARWDSLQEWADAGAVDSLPFTLEDFSLPPGEVFGKLVGRAAPGSPLVELPSLGMGGPEQDGDAAHIRLSAGYPGSFQGQVTAFVRQLRNWLDKGMKTAVVAVHRTQALRLEQILREFELGAPILEGGEGARWFSSEPDESKLAILVGRLSEGFSSEDLGRVAIREEEIFYTPVRRRAAPARRRRAFEASFHNLESGDHVVHRDYGIGVYLGVDRIGLTAEEREFLVVEYLGGDKLFVPMENLNLVQKYMGSGQGSPKIDKLGGTGWTRTKKKTQAVILEMAGKLMEVAAKRQVSQGFAFSPDDHWSREFAGAFLYEETPDQLQVIQEVTADMEKTRPMDRLVCGDVGYGKTEVALRAAFKSVIDKKQVGVLAPTTVLAEQHLLTFRERFSDYPVIIECLTRFRKKSEQKELLKRLGAGEVDILIGTHRILQSDVKFRDIGLLIVDEEQRFGVAHKERLKSLRSAIDILTLTATPIPRTLHMGLLGLRDLSVINTPPPDRLAVRTYVCQFEDRIIREALTREMERGGQAFFVHPRVETIEATARYLHRLVPGLRLAIAHGQMSEKQLHHAMVGFLTQKFDVLLCTTIIENGLDIPNANTILVNRAEMFGLAQLYQLRGRVGRSDRQAYAYFLVQAGRSLTQTARRRLKALEDLSELGSGFRLAAQDMEIRGAGNIVGPEQSGQIAAVGFNLYCRMLEMAVEELKGESAVERKEPELSLGIRAVLPEDYVPGQNQRLELYREIADTRTTGELDELERALADRYGSLPTGAKFLFSVARIRILATRAGIEKITVSDGCATFHVENRPFHLTSEFLAIPGLKFLTSTTFQVPMPSGEPDRFECLRKVLITLEACATILDDSGDSKEP